MYIRRKKLKAVLTNILFYESEYYGILCSSSLYEDYDTWSPLFMKGCKQEKTRLTGHKF